MIPIVKTTPDTNNNDDDDEQIIDRRKTREVSWKEARLSLVRIHGQKKAIIGGIVGTVDEAGKQLLLRFGLV